MAKNEISIEEFENFESPNTIGKCEDLTGKKFGRLTVLKYAGRTNCGKTGWFCRCDCGNKNIIGPIEGNHLKSGAVKSCGCYSREKTSEMMSKSNKIEFITDTVIKVYTTQGYFICNYEDWIKYNCASITWRLMKDTSYDTNGFYVRGQPKGIGLKNDSENRPVISFHRFITEAKDDEEVDHKNGCTLDNRKKENLRVCNRKENCKNLRLSCKNTSGHRGVSWSKKYRKWRARITKDKKEYHLGMFDDIEDAINAREKAEEKLFGIFSAKNSRGIENEDVPKTIDEVINELIKGD